MKGIPSKEIIMTEVTSLKGEVFYITTTALRDAYYIYKIQDNTATKLGGSKSPTELETKYINEQEKILKRWETFKDE